MLEEKKRKVQDGDRVCITEIKKEREIRCMRGEMEESYPLKVGIHCFLFIMTPELHAPDRTLFYNALPLC